MKKCSKKYDIVYNIRLIDLTNTYNKAVSFASEMMNEPEELSPYIIQEGTMNVSVGIEPDKETIEGIRQGLLEFFEKNKDKYILKYLVFDSIKISFEEA